MFCERLRGFFLTVADGVVVLLRPLPTFLRAIGVGWQWTFPLLQPDVHDEACSCLAGLHSSIASVVLP